MKKLILLVIALIIPSSALGAPLGTSSAVASQLCLAAAVAECEGFGCLGVSSCSECGPDAFECDANCTTSCVPAGGGPTYPWCVESCQDDCDDEYDWCLATCYDE
jgi:hypothetical protein